MHLATHDIPVKIDTDGATARQQPDFGAAAGRLGAEHFQMQAGTDLAPLLQGLERDACQSAHWGYVIAGRVVVDYTDGTSETCVAGDVVHWPAGHSVRVEEDAELVLFSPQADHTPVLDHLAGQLTAS
jgi:mannose-6-phosphate isomerase-like protein (cupin superfamily)